MSFRKIKRNISAYAEMIRLKKLPIQGLHSVNAEELDVIVSLTTIPSRLNRVSYTVLSLLSQAKPPKKIFLWLHESLKEALPQSLLALEGPRFEIAFTEMDSSHCKLVPSLLRFPDQIIVTCDDDEMYSSFWLNDLWQAYLKSPDVIAAYRIRIVTKDDSGKVVNYKRWRSKIEQDTDLQHSIPLGYAGVLYPAGCLNKQVVDTELYMKLCPKADDLWFKAMGFLNGTGIQVVQSKGGYMKSLPGTQEVSLRYENIREDRNRTQWLALCDRFPELSRLGITGF
ncbi:glycosyltransferase family 2 protein [Reinekea marinisedimentorum]|uniref:Glycosyl transferase family 2 n=1 Tax=Reinekea marinisedimentorum TaxID=230495 RepID=A0A4R3I7G3_9GAMM|nr:glycosyltransferase family 2 protein [Reinekea marinisedimentorum]TCS41967.1 hypothetical protein BCF53_10471 [Reinekea marinisedimentorum]